MKSVIIHTDGSCWPNPGGPGGWAAVVVSDGVRSELQGHIPAPTTNNRAEITAAIEALKSLSEPCSVTIKTDSECLRKGAAEWMWRWHRKAWKNVKNADLWMEIWSLCRKHNVIWEWVQGHAFCAENIQCDKMAEEMRTTGANAGTTNDL